MNHLLLTGASGFVGTNILTYFQSRTDVKLFALSRNGDRIRQLFGDQVTLLGTADTATIDANRITCIIHLAGIAHDLSNKFVEDDYDRVNFQDTVVIYDAFRASQAKTFVYFSSIKAAVDHFDGVLDETVQPKPQTAYGRSKRKAEQYILTHLVADKHSYILRPCMIHGPGNKGNLNLLYKFVRTGLPYPFGSFQNRRSFLGVRNLCFIVDRLIQENISSDIYNVSDDLPLSTVEVVRLIAATLGKRSRIIDFPSSVVRGLFAIIGKTPMLQKLTENMEVSNTKIGTALKLTLPYGVQDNIKHTITSFNE